MVHAAHAINSLVASWCSMYCTPFAARCAQKPDAERAKVNLTTWQSTWKSGQPWCSWDTVHVSLLWKGIYWNFTGTSKLQRLNDTYGPVPLWMIRESKVGCVRAQIRSLPLNSVINLHQGRNKRWHVLAVCCLCCLLDQHLKLCHFHHRHQSPADTLELVAVVALLYTTSQGCSLLHAIVFCLLSAKRPQQDVKQWEHKSVTCTGSGLYQQVQ